MRTFFLSILLMLVLYQSHAQDFYLGAGATLGTAISLDDDLSEKAGFGLNLRSLYKINPRWGLTGGFTYFFPQAPEPISLTAWQFNVDGTYSFVNTQAIDFYGLLGFDVVYAKAQTDAASNDDIRPGVELGIGFISGWGVFFEAKAEGAFEQLQFTLGYLYRF